MKTLKSSLILMLVGLNGPTFLSALSNLEGQNFTYDFS